MSARVRSLALAASLALVGLPLAACSGNDSGGVGVTLQDFSVGMEETELQSGQVTFDVSNEAGQTHEFVVIRTDLPADQLPTNDEGDVDENGEGIEPVDEIEDIEAGSTRSLTVDLEAGSYVAICNLPGHYRSGMHTSFTVV